MPNYKIGNKTYAIDNSKVNSFLNLAQEKGYEVEEVKQPGIGLDVTVPTERASNTGFNLENTFSELPEEITVSQKILNSFENIKLNLQSFDELLNVGTYTLARKIFGDEAVDEWAEGKSEFWTQGLTDEDMAEAVTEINRLESLKGQTGSITEGFKQGDIGEIFAGVVNAVTSFGESAIVSIPTLGAGIYTNFYARAFINVNEERAKARGLTLNEFVTSDQYADDVDYNTPLVTGIIAGGLERIGLKSVTKNFINKLPTKRLARLGARLTAGTAEGITEYGQTLTETVEKSIGQGKSKEQIANDFVNEMFSQNALESFLQGMVGGTGVATMGTLNRQEAKEAAIATAGLAAAGTLGGDAVLLLGSIPLGDIRNAAGKLRGESDFNEIETNNDKIHNLKQKLKSSKDDKSKKRIQNKIKDIQKNTNEIIAKGNNIVNQTSEKDLKELATIQDLSKKINSDLTELRFKRDNKEISEKEFNDQKALLFEEFETNKKLINNKVSDISAKNARIAEQNEKLIEVIKDPLSNEAQIESAKNKLAILNEGMINKITNQAFNAELDSDLTKADLKASISLEFAKLINSYKIDSGVPFGAYAADNLPRRLPAIYDKLVETKVDQETGKKEIVSKQDVTELQIEETVEQAEIDKPTIKKLKTALKLQDSTINKIAAAVKKVLGTSLPAVTDKKFKKSLTDAFKNELTDLVKNKEIFGKDNVEFNKFFRANAEEIYESLPLENMTKSLNRFTEKIIDPKKGKQAREATEVGKGLSRKLPYSQVKDEWLDYFLGEMGSSTKSDRKTSIAKQIADQLARDEVVDVISDPEVAQKFKSIQELEGKEVPTDFLDKIVQAIDRKIEYLNKLAENDTNLYATLISPKLFTQALATFLAGVRVALKAGKNIFEAVKAAAEQTKPVFKNQTELAEEFANDLIETFKTEKDLENQLKYDKFITKQVKVEGKIAQKEYKKYWEGKLKQNSKDIEYVKFWLTFIEPTLRLVATGSGANLAYGFSINKKESSTKAGLAYIKKNKLIDKDVLKKIKIVNRRYTIDGIEINNVPPNLRPRNDYKKKNILSIFKNNVREINDFNKQNRVALENILRNHIENNEITEAIHTLKLMQYFTESPLKMSGQIVAYQRNKNGEFVYEHVPPIQVIYELLVDSLTSDKSNSQKINDVKAILEESKVALVSEAVNTRLSEAGLAAAMHEGWKLGDDVFVRYGKDKEKLIFIEQEQKAAKANLSKEINKILEETKGIAATEVVSEASSRVKGKKAERIKLFVPYTAEDFLGLLYQFAGKGKQGDAHLAWIKKNITDVLSKGLIGFDAAQKRANDALKQAKKNIKAAKIDLGKEAVLGYSNDQAIRIHLYNKNGYDIPGVSAKEIGEIDRYVRQNLNVLEYANSLEQSYPEGIYPEPSPEWLTTTITKELLNHVNTVTRSQFLEPFFDNINEIFGKFDKQTGKLSGENTNKIRSIYGNTFIKALESALYRISTGRNRSYKLDEQGNIALDWLNDSVGTIMFFNTRSAILQTISAINYTNWTDNNPLKQAQAWSNQKQFWNDFTFLFNSDYLKQRRSGLRTDINADEIADAAEGSTNKIRAVLSAILKKGFLPTQYADSFAISIGGASFYRNRINSYKDQGFTQQEAESKAFKDWRELSEEAQQSSRPDKISMEQASFLGRVILAFQNTPMQYNRLMKKAILDLSNGRGDWKTNLSKIIYYGAVQNMIFYAMQQGLFALLFDEEEEEEEKERYANVVNGMADSILRGSGIFGAIASTTKNTIFKLIEENKEKRPDYTNVIQELSSLSPPLNSKFRKLRSAGRKFTYRQELEKMKELGIDTKNPAILAGSEVLSALANLPGDRALYKINNLRTAMEEETEFWQSVALTLGWNEWSLGMRNNDKTQPNTFGLKEIKLKDIKLKDIELKDIN